MNKTTVLFNHRKSQLTIFFFSQTNKGSVLSKTAIKLQKIHETVEKNFPMIAG